MQSEVAILAGGFGERLKPISGDLIKPMMPVLGVPILEHAIRSCAANGFRKILLLIGYRGEQIREYFGNGHKFGVQITYASEDVPRGTGGALLDALDLLQEDFLVLYSDVFFDVDLKKFISFHFESHNDITLFLHPNDHPQDSDLIELDLKDNVLAFHSYPHSEDLQLDNIVNAGIYAVKKNSLVNIQLDDDKFDIVKRLFPLALSRGTKFKGYISCEYVKDMGTPDRLKKVENSILSGAVKKLSARGMREAVFLDRDGTIIEFVEYLNAVNQLQILHKAADAISMLNAAGILAICVTNQPVVARGELSLSDLHVIHRNMISKLGREGAYLDRIDYCPHHPDAGFDGEVVHLKHSCDCRKPSTGLVEKWSNFYNIDKKKSWFIGDTSTDILTGYNAGLKTVLVRTGRGGADRKFDIEADYVFPNLLESVRWICSGYEAARRHAMRILDDAEISRFILIGGLARSGKSTFSRVMADVCRELGHTAHVVSLDAWLKPLEDRRSKTGVFNRYDLDKFGEFFNEILNATSTISLKYTVPDPLTKSPLSSRNLIIDTGDIVILEGVAILALKSISRISAPRVYVDICEELRFERMKEYYADKGYSNSQIESVLSSRAKDELPTILKSRDSASYIVRSQS